MGNSSLRLEPRSFSGKFEISARIFLVKKPKISKNPSQDPSKSRPGASKIEPRGFQNQAPGPPKSSPGPSKTRFFKTSNLRR